MFGGFYEKWWYNKTTVFTSHKQSNFVKTKKHHITQNGLGNKIGVSATTIGRYEKGEVDIPSSNLPLISKYCDFKLREYLKEWESADLESFIKESLTIDTIETDYEIIQE